MHAVSVSLAQIRALKPDSPQRREAVRLYLRENRDLRIRAAIRAKCDPSQISRVLHGYLDSAYIVEAIEAEEKASRKDTK
jgi:hypothetical protein